MQMLPLPMWTPGTIAEVVKGLKHSQMANLLYAKGSKANIGVLKLVKFYNKWGQLVPK